MMPLFDKIVTKCSKWVIKHSVEIAMTAAGIGVAATVYTTSRATLKVNTIIKDESLTKKEKIKKSIIPCAPAVGAIALTYTALIAMYICGKKKQAALLSLLVSTQQLLQNYRIETRKRIGEREEAEVYAKAYEKTHPVEDDIFPLEPREDECIFIEPITGQVFTMTMSDLIYYEKELNKQYILTGSVTFDEWLSYLDVDSDELFSHYGWGYYGYYQYGYQFLEFRHLKRTDKNGRVFYIIMYDYMPHADYEDEVDYKLFEVDPHYNVELQPEVDLNFWSTRDVLKELG